MLVGLAAAAANTMTIASPTESPVAAALHPSCPMRGADGRLPRFKSPRPPRVKAKYWDELGSRAGPFALLWLHRHKGRRAGIETSNGIQFCMS